MSKHSRTNKRKRGQKKAVRIRGVMLRRPWIAGVATAAGGVLLDSAADYWGPGAWDWLCALLRGVFM